MCLIGLALDAHPRFALVIAANRDEFFDRPTAPLDWWRTSPETPWLLGGRDLSAGGTWMALSEQGRIGMLTNVRDPSRHRPDAPSRGSLVTAWLDGSDDEAQGHNPFNLIGGDLKSGRWWWRSDSQAATPLPAGVHALSNAALNEPWPKVRRLSLALEQALRGDDETMAERLFGLLGDRDVAADADLPDTRIGIERERLLSPVFVTMPDGRYGTRCSTVVLGERDDDAAWRLNVIERSHDCYGAATGQRRVTLLHWPRPGHRPAVSAA
jgi:uncharacterized protein with NRDE domain